MKKDQKTESAGDSGFFGVLSGLVSYLSFRRTQAHMGKSGSSMKFDEKSGRWMIDGQVESDDDEPPPPPGLAKKATRPAQKLESNEACDLTKPAFSGALANRGRGSRGKAKPNKQSQVPPAIPESKETQEVQAAVEEKVDSRNDVSTVQEADGKEKENDLYKTAIDIQQNHKFSELEQQYIEQIVLYKEKLAIQKDRVKRFKKELLRCRDENEQTIEHFTQLCQDLKIRGTEEVEELQARIGLLERQNSELIRDKAVTEFNSEKQEEEIKNQQEIIETLKQLSQESAEMPAPEVPSGQSRNDMVHKLNESQLEVFDLIAEKEELLWQITSLKQNDAKNLLQLRSFSGRLNQVQSLLDKEKAQNVMWQQRHDMLERETRQNIELINNQSEQLHNVLKQQLDEVSQDRELKRQSIFDYQRQVADYQAELTLLKNENAILQNQVQKRELLQRNKFGFKPAKLENHVTGKQDSSGYDDSDCDISEDESESESSEEDEHEEQLRLVTEEEKEHGQGYHSATMHESLQRSKSKTQVNKTDTFENSDVPVGSQNTKDNLEKQVSEQIRELTKQQRVIDEESEKKAKGKTVKQILKQQLEEQRNTIRDEFQVKLNLQRQLKKTEQAMEMQKDGYRDLYMFLVGIVSHNNIELSKAFSESTHVPPSETEEEEVKSESGLGDQQSTVRDQERLVQNIEDEFEALIHSSQWDRLIERFMSLIFEIQRFYQQQKSELTHRVSILNLQSDQNESLSLDLEIANQENQLLEQEVTKLRNTLQTQQSNAEQIQKQIKQSIQDNSEWKAKAKDLHLQLEDAQNKIQSLKSSEQELVKKHRLEIESSNQRVKDLYESELMPSQVQKVEVSCSTKLQEIRREVADTTQQLEQERVSVKVLRDELFELEQKLSSSQQERQQFEEKAKFIELELKSAQNESFRHEREAQILKEQTEMRVKDIQARLDQQMGYCKELQEQIETQRDSHEERVSTLKEATYELKLDNQNKQKQLSQEQETLKQSQEEVLELQQVLEEMSEKASKMKEEEDEKFWQLINQVNQSAKEVSHLKATVKDRERRCSDLQEKAEYLNQKVADTEQELLDEKCGTQELKDMHENTKQKVEQLEYELKQQQASNEEQLMGKQDEINSITNKLSKEKEDEMEMDNLQKDLIAQIAKVDEFQGLLEYQIQINDQLNQNYEKLEQEHESFRRQQQIVSERDFVPISRFDELSQQLKTLKDERESQEQEQSQEFVYPTEATSSQVDAQALQSQFEEVSAELQDVKKELGLKREALDEKEKDCEAARIELGVLNNNISSKNKSIEQLQAAVSEASRKLEQKVIEYLQLEGLYQQALQQLEASKSQLLQNGSDSEKIKQLQDREQQFKQAAEEMAQKYKEKISKHKEKYDALQSKLSALEQDKEKAEKRVADYEQEFSKVFDFLETSKLVENSDIRNLSRLSLNLSVIDEKCGQLQEDRAQLFLDLVQILNESGLDEVKLEQFEYSDSSKKTAFEKLAIALQNYLEDKRQMAVLVLKNDELVKSNQQLEDQNYDLRYELQEAIKLQVKPKQATEVVVSNRAIGGAYADLSVNKDLPEDGEAKHSESVRPAEELKKTTEHKKGPQKQVKGSVEGKQEQPGYFSSIVASLFLTDSEISGQPGEKGVMKVQTQKGEGGEVSEYEYYEEYYEESTEGAAQQ